MQRLKKVKVTFILIIIAFSVILFTGATKYKAVIDANEKNNQEVLRRVQVEEAKLAAEKKLEEEQRITEQKQITKEQKIVEEAKLAEIERLAEEARIAEEVKQAEKERLTKIDYWMNYQPTQEDYNRWKTYGRTIIQKTEWIEDKVVYLTFDDGPMYATTPILDILREYDVKATFFVNGLRSSKQDENDFKLETYKHIVEEGHVLGNHTFSHNYKEIYSSPEAYLKDFFELEELLYDITGEYTKIMRFPGGSNNTIGGKYLTAQVIDAVHDLGYSVFDWNVMDHDTSSPTLDQMRDYVIKGVRGAGNKVGPIIVLYHDTHYGHKTTLPQVIEQLKSEGYTFDVLTKESTELIFNGPNDKNAS